MKITFIQTGGTIDKDYPQLTKGWAFEIADPAIERILEKLNPSFEYEVLSVLKKDSMEITTEDRDLLHQTISTLESNKVIITHGTDTMRETATHLSAIKGKTIILTGAMKPERFANSDAPINLGVAIGAVNTLAEGTYIAMHGKVMAHDEVNRNMETGKYF
jgi:L-asparaginase